VKPGAVRQAHQQWRACWNTDRDTAGRLAPFLGGRGLEL